MPGKTYGNYTLDELANAFMQVESSGGKNSRRRFEPGFLKRYLSKTLEPDFESLASKYGREAMATSYGPFQIIYRTAYEHGFRGSPEDLESPQTNRQYFNKIFDSMFRSSGSNLDKAILRYNGGGNSDYLEKVKRYLPKRQVSMVMQQLSPVEMRLYKADKMMRSAGFAKLSPAELQKMANAHVNSPQAVTPGLSPAQGMQRMVPMQNLGGLA